MHTYRNNLREGVVFLFVDDSERVLIETRPDSKGEYKESFFPNGSVEVRDKLEGGNAYQETAMLREVTEEFAGQVTPIAFQKLGSVEAKEICVVFDVFLIKQWAGRFPDWSVEDGKPFGKLTWMPLNSVCERVPYDSAKQIIEMLNARVADE